MGRQVNETRARLILFGRDALLRESLAALLDSEPGLVVIGQCAERKEAVELLGRVVPDVLLMSWEGRADLETLWALRSAAARTAILILGAEIDAADAVQALRLGAAGVFLQASPLEKLVAAVRMVAAGDAWMDRGLLRLVAEEQHSRAFVPYQLLTEREREVLRGVVNGESNREIGAATGSTEGAVKRTVYRLFEKTGMRSRVGLVRLALDPAFGMPVEAAGKITCP
jgi:DNA-binding NarL/FixJ family response regulator